MRHKPIALLAASLFATLSYIARSDTNAAAPGRSFRIFDGKPKRVHLVTNSHGGYRELKEYIARMPGAEKIEVTQGGGASFNGKPGGQPPNWAPAEKLPDDRPAIFIVYNSVDATAVKGFKLPEKFMEQWDGASLDRYLMAYNETVRITEEEIEKALASMRHQVESATAKGVGLMILSNTHYNRYGRGGAAGMDGSEEVVRRWNATELGRQHPAVDVRTATAKVYPLGVREDRFHTRGAGKYINAYHWFGALCAWDGVEVPAWAQQIMDEAVAKEKANRDAIQNIVLTPKGPYQVGDPVTITWDSDATKATNFAIHFSPGTGMWPGAATLIASNVVGSKFVWTIPETVADAKGTQSTVSATCFIRINTPPTFYRATEVPFQIKPREAKP